MPQWFENFNYHAIACAVSGRIKPNSLSQKIKLLSNNWDLNDNTIGYLYQLPKPFCIIKTNNQFNRKKQKEMDLRNLIILQ